MWDLKFESHVSQNNQDLANIRLTPTDLGPTQVYNTSIDFYFVELTKAAVSNLKNCGALFLERDRVNFERPAWIFQFSGGQFANVALGNLIAYQVEQVSSHILPYGSTTLATPHFVLMVSHSINTDNGSSGAPIFQVEGKLVAIHCGSKHNFLTVVNLGATMDSVCSFIEERILGPAPFSNSNLVLREPSAIDTAIEANDFDFAKADNESAPCSSTIGKFLYNIFKSSTFFPHLYNLALDFRRYYTELLKIRRFA